MIYDHTAKALTLTNPKAEDAATLDISARLDPAMKPQQKWDPGKLTAVLEELEETFTIDGWAMDHSAQFWIYLRGVDADLLHDPEGAHTLALTDNDLGWLTVGFRLAKLMGQRVKVSTGVESSWSPTHGPLASDRDFPHFPSLPPEVRRGDHITKPEEDPDV